MRMNLLSGNFILTNLMKLKLKYFDEPYITKEEYNFVKNVLRKKYDIEKLEIIITDTVDTNYFKIEDIITLNDISIEEVESKYIKNIPKYIRDILWNEFYIYKQIINNRNNKILKKRK